MTGEREAHGQSLTGGEQLSQLHFLHAFGRAARCSVQPTRDMHQAHGMFDARVSDFDLEHGCLPGWIVPFTRSEDFHAENRCLEERVGCDVYRMFDPSRVGEAHRARSIGHQSRSLDRQAKKKQKLRRPGRLLRSQCVLNRAAKLMRFRSNRAREEREDFPILADEVFAEVPRG